MKFLMLLSLWFILGYAAQAQVAVGGYPGYPVQVQQPHDPYAHAKAVGVYGDRLQTNLPINVPPPVQSARRRLPVAPAPQRQVRCTHFKNQTICN